MAVASAPPQRVRCCSVASSALPGRLYGVNRRCSSIPTRLERARQEGIRDPTRFAFFVVLRLSSVPGMVVRALPGLGFLRCSWKDMGVNAPFQGA